MDPQGSSSDVFDPRCERMDVAIRAVIKVTIGDWSNWEQAAVLGLSREEHGEALLDGVAACDDLRNEDDLFRLVQACPFLVPAAQLALGLYQAATAPTRPYSYGRLSA